MHRARTIPSLTLACLLTGTIPVVVSGEPARGEAGDKVAPAIHTAINYPGFPTTNPGPTPYFPALTAGPHLIAATARPAEVTGTTADVFLVFSEDLIPASISTAASGAGGTGNPDIWAYGFTFAGVAATGNTVRLTGAIGADPSDQVRLAALQAVTGVDGSMSSDVSPSVLTTGPVITSVRFVAGYGDSLADNDSLRVTFDATVAFGAGDGAGNTFWRTEEFGMTGPFTPPAHLTSTVSGSTISLGLNRWNGNPGNHHFRFIQAGVSKLIVDAGKVIWNAVATENSRGYAIPIAAPYDSGPFARAIYYNRQGSSSPSDDEIWVVMSAPIDPLTFGFSIEEDFNTDVDGGFFSITSGTGTVASAAPLDFCAVLRLTGFESYELPSMPMDLMGAQYEELANHQGGGSTTGSVPVLRGPGIIRASYDDRRTVARGDDQLYLWLNEPAAYPASIGLTDFSYFGFSSNGLGLMTDVIGATQRVTIHGFTSENHPRPGSRIRANTGNGIFGALSSDEMYGGPAAPMILVEDETRPSALQMTVDPTLTRSVWNEALGIDSVFVAWAEGGSDDADQYFAFVTKEIPDNIDASWMNACLSRVLAVGNPRPGDLDATIRIGFLVDPSEGSPHPGAITRSADLLSPDLAEGDLFYILIAAADYQGNLSLRFDPSSAANALFGPFFVGPVSGAPAQDETPDAFSVSVRPNPSAGEPAIRLGLARGGPVQAMVFDVGGGQVRELFAGSLQAGVRTLTWDGRDQTGRPVPSGAYFVRVAGAAGQKTERLVVIR